MIKNIFLLYIFGGLLLVSWDMRYRVLAWVLHSQKYNTKSNIESPLYVNNHGLDRIKGALNIIFIWPLRICISTKRIFQNRVKTKTKKSNVLENFFDEIYKIHFPGGRKQVQNQTNEIIKLSNGRLDFKKAQSMLLKGKSMLSINKSRAYNSMKLNFGDVLNKNELKTIMAFIMFNSVNKSKIRLVEISFNTENVGYNEDQIPTGQGEFGHCSTNPIPVNGIMTNEVYLGKLLTTDNKKIKWKRKGSIESVVENVVGKIDIYDIFDEDGNYLKKLYISPYNQKLSGKAPAGFILKAD
ncbi:MAG: hypothetical protein U9R14_04000 [Patescibacteria group bacterium]|nr:hypothetical protein [Patescibacteria group bacterium]